MKTITIIPLFAVLAALAVTGCGNHTADNQSGANNTPVAPTPPVAGNTNPPMTSTLPEIPPPATAPPAPSTPVPAPPEAPAMTSPGNGVDTNAPAATNSPGVTNPPSGS